MRLPDRLTTAGAAFQHRGFRCLSAGSSLNSAAMQGEQVILGYMVYQLTGSSAWVGLSLALFFAPMLLVGIPAGALADRFDRRQVLIATEAALLIALALFGLCLMLEQVGLLGALLMSTVSGTLRAIHHPARLSYAGDVAGAGSLLAALSLLGISSRFGQLLGALTAGFVSEAAGAASAYAVLATAHAIALWTFIQSDSSAAPNHADQTAPTGVVNGVFEYLRLIQTHTTLLALVILASLVEILGFSFATAMPELAIERLAVHDGGLGAMHAMRAAGGLTGAIILSVLVTRRVGRFFLFVMVLFGAALIALALAPSFNSVLLAIGLVALCASWTDILVQSMLQICTPVALRGRAMGAWVFALGMGPIGHLELGLLLTTFGTVVALASNGIALILIGLTAALLIPALRAIELR